MIEPELAKFRGEFGAVRLGRLRQKHVVVHDLPHPDAARDKMPLDMRKLHRERELHRRNVEPLGNRFRMGYLIIQEPHEARRTERVPVARRRPVVNLDRYAVRGPRQVQVVARCKIIDTRGDIVVLARFGQQPHATEQGIDTFAAPLDPDVDIATLAHERVGIEERVRGPLEDGALAALRLEQPGEPSRLAIDELVLPPDGLRLARPLEYNVERRLSVLRQLADTGVCDPQKRLLGSHTVEAGPVLGGQDIRELPRFAESNPQEVKETFVQTVRQ